MSRITPGGNWADNDRLDDVELKDGERLRITWPNDTVSEHVIQIKKETHTISDMGSPYTISSNRAFVLVMRGLKLIPYCISGYDAERV